MTPCPRCRSRGVYQDDTRLVCLLCGHVVSDAVPLIDRLISNTNDEAQTVEQHNEYRGPLGPREQTDIAALTDRIMAGIRKEVGR